VLSADYSCRAAVARLNAHRILSLSPLPVACPGSCPDARLLRANTLAGRGEHARATDDASAVAREEGVSQVNHYNIACVFAVSSAAAEKDGKLAPSDRSRLKAQYADRAMDFLRQAVALGYQDIAVLKGDPELATLRSREDFQKLFREVEQKSRK
jgi:hypothetical protein